MDEKDRRPTVQPAGDPSRRNPATTDAAAPRRSTTLWRMRSAMFDNQASCSVTEGDDGGCEVLVIFAKGLGVPEHFDDVRGALRHSMEIAGRLTVQGWVDIDLRDD